VRWSGGAIDDWDVGDYNAGVYQKETSGNRIRVKRRKNEETGELGKSPMGKRRKAFHTFPRHYLIVSRKLQEKRQAMAGGKKKMKNASDVGREEGKKLPYQPKVGGSGIKGGLTKEHWACEGEENNANLMERGNRSIA